MLGIRVEQRLSAAALGGALLLSVVLGSVLAVNPVFAVAAVVLSLLLALVATNPESVSLVIAGVVLAQPLLLRLIPDSAEYWLWVKRADEGLLALVFPFALLRLLSKGAWPLPRTATIAACALAAAGAIGALIRETPIEVAALDAFLLFKGVLFFVIVTAFCPSLGLLKRVFPWTLGIGLVLGAFGLLELAAPDLVRTLVPLSSSGYRSGITCLVSIFEGEGQAGWFFAFLAVLAFSVWVVLRRRAALYLFLFFAACSLLTLRRKPIGGIVFVLLVYAVLAYRPHQRIRAVAVLVALILIVGVTFGDTVVGVFVDGYQTYVGADDPMRVARNAMYATSFQLARDSFPIGVGFGLFGGFASRLNYSPIYFEYGLSRVWGLSPDNPRFIMDAFWPHVLGQFGVIGLLSFLALLGSLWGPALAAARKAASPAVQLLALVAVLSLAEALVESTAESIFETTLPCILLFGIAAAARAHVVPSGQRLERV